MGVEMILDDKKIKPEQLEDGFYFYRFDEQTQFTVPRKTKAEVLEVMGRAKKVIYLTPADFPFISFYDGWKEIEKWR